MKKIYLSAVVIAMAMFLSYCHSAKKATASAAPAPLTYESTIHPIVMTSCSPCHTPSKGGNKENYEDVANVKKDIDGILRRINLNPTDRGFMPMRHPKLSADTIAIFQKWKDQGLAEK